MKGLIAVKFDEQDRKLLVKVCGERRESISGFVRRAVMAELARLDYPIRSRSLGSQQLQPTPAKIGAARYFPKERSMQLNPIEPRDMCYDLLLHSGTG